jgi:hypothetical protein
MAGNTYSCSQEARINSGSFRPRMDSKSILDIFPCYCNKQLKQQEQKEEEEEDSTWQDCRLCQE